MPIKPAVVFLVCTVAFLSDAFPQEPKPAPVPFLLQIVESQTDLSPDGGITSDCILVQPNGRFHMEERRQHLPSPSAKLTIYESRLDKPQLEMLRNILGQQNIQGLPPFVRPNLPVSVAKFRLFSANIRRESATQRTGFFAWEGLGTPNSSPNSTPDDIKRAWQISANRLQPLVEWFHEIEGLKLHASHAKSTLCGTGTDDH